jgi:ubiquinone/menaquinone biosynthesis C-methylase UbiE
MKKTSDFWRTWWDDCAKHATSDYALNRGTTVRLTALERKAEEQFLQDVAPAATDIILDAGCGSGRNLPLLAPRVKEIVALDYAPEMIKRVRERIGQEGLVNVSPVLGSVTDLPFPAGSFDKVVCTSVLQYLNDEECGQAFREMFRVCRSGGTVVVHLKNGSSLYGLSKYIANKLLSLAGRRGLPEHYRRWSKHRAMIEAHGGSIIDLNSFGILTFVGLPRRLVPAILNLEMKLTPARGLRRFGVNSQLLIRVTKPSASNDACVRAQAATVR